MAEVFRVAIHHDDDCGYIEYDSDTRKLKVVLDDPAKRGEIEAFLSKAQIIREAQTLLEFKEATVLPTDSVGTLKAVLGQLWQNTDVFVDWSRPVDIR